MGRMKEFLKGHRPIVALIGTVLVLATFPVLAIYLVIGNAWQGIPPAFTDEGFYYARVQTILHGHPTEGNPYFLEHSDGPPLVIFGGTWLNAIPQLAGLSLNVALLVNFIVWSLLFAASLYWLFRELRVPSWIAVSGTVFVYVQSYAHVWRAVNLQTVYPLYFLFYVALARIIREQSRKNVILLALTTGAAFYLFAYLWQVIVITLGILFLYALVQKNWPLLKAALLSLFIGGVIGLPVPLYALWLSRASPYFWESVGRLGLVDTHLPMAEVIYSGGWIGVALIVLAVLYSRIPAFREDKEFTLLGLFLAIGGLGLWVMQGSNFITGKLLETGEHIRLLILPWLVFFTVSVGVFLWKRRTQLSGKLKAFSVTAIVLLSAVNLYFIHYYSFPFFNVETKRESWLTIQSYAKPFAWLEREEKNSVVVWSDPYDGFASSLPVYTKHFVLYAWSGMMELVPEDEVRERYLISQYFDNPMATDLKNINNMKLYLGRRDMPHQAKTIERGIKICRILFFFNKNKDCGTPPSPQSLLGDKFFEDLENKFQTDIKPSIKAYLKKYHVSYILKDKVLDPQYHPEILGAVRVYSDDRYEIWHI